MRAILRTAIVVFILTFLTACTRDLYSKYLRMKQESVWVQKTCIEGLAKEIRYVYKGSSASVWIACNKPSSVGSWATQFKVELQRAGWNLKKQVPYTDVYCLGNEGISMLVTPVDENSNRSIVLSYPDRRCAIQPVN